MKIKLSVSLENELIEKAKSLLNNGKFRNKSHLIEYALMVFLQEELK
jgi:Arc/MetJ-type ribon-helix-helix transcriptional regulator